MLALQETYSRMFAEAWKEFRTGAFDTITLDIETTIKRGSPMPHDGAKIVLVGTRINGEPVQYWGSGEAALRYIADLIAADKRYVIVGHNLKFDLHHLRAECKKAFEQVMGFTQVIGFWDTMIYEYLDSGQLDKTPSLESAAKRMGVPFKKNDDVTSMFNRGYGADHIEPKQLEKYLEEDVITTECVFEAQREKCQRHLMGHMFVQGWAMLGYTRMEDNGLPINRKEMIDLDVVLENNIRRRSSLISATVDALMGIKVDACTNRTFSTVFFGAPGVPVKAKEAVGTYKNGKTKWKTVTEMRTPAEHLDPHDVFPPGTEMHNENLGWKMDEDTLQSIINLEETTIYGKLATLILAARKDEKIASTYVAPMLERSLRGGRVHHSINQCVTDTGRTSSSNPNGQNMPDVIRKMVSTQDDDRVIYSADFKQLEMVIAAQLSGDNTLMGDLETSDAHYETGLVAGMWRSPSEMDKDKRRIIKGVNFGTIYGGSAKTLALQTGVDEELVKKIQGAFFDRYGRYAEWRDHLLKMVQGTPGCGKPVINEDGTALYVRPYMSETGRKYMFRERPKPWKPTDIGPVPSQVYNYPVQGTATGDIVPLFVAVVAGYRWSPTMEPINAVHDSVVFEVDKGLCAVLENFLNDVAHDLTPLCGLIYSFHMTTCLILDHEWGPTWT